MNHKLIVKKIALSTLLLSVAASPVYASAASEPATALSASTISISKTEAVPALTIHKLVDPLELAATYAPDTVNEWKATLDRYKGALPKSVAVRIIADSVAGVETLSNDNAVQVTSASSNQFISAYKLNVAGIKSELVELPNPADMKFETSASVATIPALGIAKDLDHVEVGKAVPIDNGEVVSRLSITTFTDENTLFKGQIDLEQAALSKDAEAIQKSLGKLMELYKEQIVKWETLK